MLWLVLQVVLASVSVVVVDRAALGPRRGPETASRDVWLPLIMVAPLLVLAAAGGRAAGADWVPIGAVATIATVSFGIALLARPSERLSLKPVMMMWLFAGVVILLLGAAHALWLSVGQCALGAGVVLMWVNTPSHHEPADGTRSGSLFLAMLLAIGHGAAAWPSDPRLGGVLAAATAVAIAVVIVRRRGPADTLVVAGWAASYGVLLGLGVLSTAHLLPQIRPIIGQQQSTLAALVSIGFGRRAFDGAMLLAAVLVAIAAWRGPAGVRRIVGILLVIAGIAAAALGTRPGSTPEAEGVVVRLTIMGP